MFSKSNENLGRFAKYPQVHPPIAGFNAVFHERALHLS